MPVFLSTNVYAKHRLRLAQLFGKVWSEMRVQAVSATCKGDAAGIAIRHRDANPAMLRCKITGEPLHDIIALRKLVSLISRLL